ncbi:hypothetical protein BDV95DRAFT_61069 [Massariosphaeria phaeospora]|uniref:N-acetyltransferase domain-containing protein n=1 Tax=Massariosphaeria phaeospora TaxID=100035 RepID=A0A7C8M6T3_9PLEO|nr:hypothetical protein BDV95DRAFT_61069 [Massariosphaeria phaeospora]
MSSVTRPTPATRPSSVTRSILRNASILRNEPNARNEPIHIRPRVQGAAMSYTLCTVALGDLKELVRHCDHPAMQENPLYLTMFPNASPESSEEEIMWHLSSFRESFEKTPGAYSHKVCFNDRTPVGFALWTVDQACPVLHIGPKESRPEALVPR